MKSLIKIGKERDVVAELRFNENIALWILKARINAYVEEITSELPMQYCGETKERVENTVREVLEKYLCGMHGGGRD